MQATTDTTLAEGSTSAGRFYRAAWRWHFYAALFVLPFLMILPVSGALMLLRAPLESVVYSDLLHVDPGDRATSAETQLHAVRQAFPDSQVLLYVPPRSSDQATQFSITPPGHAAHGGHGGHDAPSLTVFVDPYSAAVLGSVDPATTFYAWARAIHSSLLLGQIGDYLIEIAAGLAVLMVVSGLYLAWPRNGKAALQPRLPPRHRSHWRGLHGLLGLTLALPLLFFLISGLTWTSVWGGQLTQAWSTLPGTTFKAPTGTDTHADLNRAGLEEMPWALAQTPLPASGSGTGAPGISGPVDLDSLGRFAASEGFDAYRVHLPRGPEGVWTISATTIAGDTQNPLTERILHLDRDSGRVLADVRFDDYSLPGQAMAASIPLHQGDLGIWNVLLNLALCGGVMAIALSGTVMCWKRRPAGRFTAAPPVVEPAAWKGALAVMFVLSLAFPLAAATIAVVVVLDAILAGLPRLTAMRN
jgi:uncharacterized iron-regulated membrane protein